ncbi:sensor histidine kinase [Parabacteroides gordonii]|uniref:histidine kinase n=1 Tax=Parabacteroides gordonii MS-1 = DSM 23371 TaxID=1203610 RepID=A0A0F5JLM3_9BACT|nr:HAMP domain-containing sensor histidine kinase [Parabacteroides gordonii]KKB58347.1 hypothetical protein HMPREF1536_01222 [Parabacteroides gordonii MS-1 = DSM 23371]MCA5583383.1 HAMP domain-containing histidine kinase [Parabacteroides gordonii]RGP16056.1 sensor histidine kinase [Parabacteroides gordonii]
MRACNIYTNKCFLVTFILYVMSQYSLSAQPDSLLISHKIDSLESLLSVSSDPHVRIPVLTRLADLNNQTPVEVAWLERCYEEACRIDSIPAVYFALLNLSRHYYNEYGLRDSILYWGRKIDSISKSRNEYPNALFDAKSYSCQDLLWSGEYEAALNEALNEYHLASEIGHPYGLVRCTESLGLIYKRLRRDSVAVVVFQEGIDMLDDMDCSEVKRRETRMRMSAYQAECATRVCPFEQALGIFKRYEAAVDSMAVMTMRTETFAHIKREYWLLYSSYADLYIREDMLAEARQMLAKANKYVGNVVVEGDYVENTYRATLAHYYRKTGNLSKAAQLMEEIFKTERIPIDLQFQAEVLEEQGRLSEALVLYDELNDMSLQRNKKTFIRQVNLLRALHELKNKEEQEHEMQVNKERMAEKQRQILFLSVVFIILLCLLYVLLLYYQRARRLKNELLKEKHSLLESENNLKCEKAKAEEASRMKSAFIANMSHEIRTPLNAIVGFSDLLVDGSGDPDEADMYASVIKNNTEQLLNLVNDVLDLSRMETGDLNFKFDDYSLTECCQRALDSVRHRIPEGVELTFTPDIIPVTLHTDKLRLLQILTNLLTNSAKFTQKGEINLSYKVDEDGKQVHISVTDTGCGIPKEKQSSVFQRFEKLDDYKPGAGLGLSICTLIADRLNGTFAIDPTYENGARFIFTHPCGMPSSTCNRQTGEVN